jgi:hypothetical protein
MPADSDRMVDEIRTAIEHLRRAEQYGCGTCGGFLRNEVEHLDMFVDLSQKTDALVGAQEATASTLERGNARADTALGAAPSGPRRSAGGGPIQFFREFVRDRVRVVDVLSPGGR